MRVKFNQILALSIPITLIACTIEEPSTKQVHRLLNPPVAEKVVSHGNFSDFKPGQAIIKSEGTTENVTFTYKAPDFSSQNINAANLASIKLTLVGSDITTALTNDGNTFVPVNGGTATATISNVPIKAGNIRVVSVQGYDSNNVALPAFVGKGFYKSTAGTTSITIVINRRQYLTGLVLENLITNASPQANTIDTAALQASIDTATGFNGTTFTTDPTQFDVSDIVNLINTNGAVPTSTQITTNAAAAAQNVTIHIKTTAGGNFNENVSININDPNSTPQTVTAGTASPTTSVLSVNPGTWTVFIKKTNGTLLAQTSVTITANGAVTVTAGQGDTAPNALALAVAEAAATMGPAGVIPGPACPTNTSCLVTTVVGTNGAGSADGIGTGAQVSTPEGLAMDSAGNLYISNFLVHTIKRVAPGTSGSIDTDSVVTTILGQSGTFGTADGQGTAATFRNPSDMAFDSAGNLYIVDTTNHRIRRVDSALNVTTILGGTVGSDNGVGTAARFSNPRDILIDNSGNLYISDTGNHRIRKVDTALNVTTFVGQTGGFSDGNGTAARFNIPDRLAMDSAGILYISDRDNNRVRRVDSAGNVTTIAGNATQNDADGVGTAATFEMVRGLIVDGAGHMYVGTQGPAFGQTPNLRLVSINSATSVLDTGSIVTTVAGRNAIGTQDGVGTAAGFNYISSIVIDSAGNMYVTSQEQASVRKIVAQ